MTEFEEKTVKISKSEYARRRKNLMSMMDTNSIALIPAAHECTRSRDTEYPFRQDSDFLYLTGFNEPDAVLVLVPGRRQGQVILFCRDRDVEMELWNGYRAGPEGAVTTFGMDDAFPINDIDDILPGLLEGKQQIYYSMGHNDSFDRRVMAWVNAIRRQVRTGAKPPGDFTDLAFVLHEQRLFKSAAELRIMRKAGEISAKAHVQAMRECIPGRYEYHLEGAIARAFAEYGARYPAYNSIVGAGANACVLHYTENEDKLNDGDLVLIDAGCEIQGYAGDITRTFPVNGSFTSAQAELYDVVLSAQAEAIEAMVVGKSIKLFHEAALRRLTEGLIELKIINGPLETALEDKRYLPYYMHGTGHFLGLDVHDVGAYEDDGKPVELAEGMVITCEPGLYISKLSDAPARYRGIGIRIEDDVLITKRGPEVLTSLVPKERADIEALMRG